MERPYGPGAIGSIASVLCVAVLMAACDSGSPTQPTPLAPVTTASLSGVVFEVVPGGRIPAPGIPLIAVVATELRGTNSFSMRFTRVGTTTGPDGRYQLSDLPQGSAIILPDTLPTYRLVCGAAANLGPATRLDVEITSSANPQPSPTNPPLRITGQVYEMTPAGRVGVDRATVWLEWKASDSPFVSFDTGSDGRYTMCGIPPNTLVAFGVWKEGYDDPYDWHTFGGDSTVDIEMKRD